MNLITGLDHIVLVCPDIEAGVAAYSTVLGREPDWQASADGAATALFTVQNTALELMAPDGEGAVASRLREIIAEKGPGLTSLAFRTDDIGEAHHILTRRGLIPGNITDGQSSNLASDAKRRWKRFRCSDEQAAGLKIFVIEPENPITPAPASAGSVISLDNIVVNTPNPDRAAALYGARLGLDMKLDRTAEQWSTRFLFFKTGGLTFEVIHRLDGAHDPAASDSLWGLTWTVDDLAASHARISDAGLDVSEIRTGRKPGTQVFTLRNGTLNVPTLFISHAAR